LNAADGKPAKLTLKARGPHRALEEAGENSCHVQKLMAVQLLTQGPGKRMKELAMQMEKLSSSLAVCKRVVEETLAKQACTQGWCQSKTNLAEDGLASPFNFSIMQGGETHRIANEVWKALKNCKGVKSGRVDTNNLSQIKPSH
jgi:hypothetical protein